MGHTVLGQLEGTNLVFLFLLYFCFFVPQLKANMEASKVGGDKIPVFSELTPKNLGQLKLLNSVIFPVHYNDKFYQDLLISHDLTYLCKLLNFWWVTGLQSCLDYYQDVLVGAVCCRIENKKSEGGGRRMYIMTLGVLAPYRRLKIGWYLFAISSRKELLTSWVAQVLPC